MADQVFRLPNPWMVCRPDPLGSGGYWKWEPYTDGSAHYGLYRDDECALPGLTTYPQDPTGIATDESICTPKRDCGVDPACFCLTDAIAVLSPPGR